jgi:KipI family sensor histidine kinase inhibitor
MDARLLPVGTDAVLVEVDGLAAALAAFDAITQADLPGVAEVVPAARTVLVVWEEGSSPEALGPLIARIPSAAHIPAPATGANPATVPVCYDGEDLEPLARHLGVAPRELAARHTEAVWRVAFNGFMPGFSYLICDDPLFQDVPRLETPRVAVPAGSVGLARQFSAIYPRVSPAGWQIIGRSPLPMWDARRDQPATLLPGDTVRFVATNHADPPPEPAPRSWPDAYGLRVLRPGFQATLQDDGRRALAMGVSRSGAMDLGAFHAANQLVGNDSGAPALEIAYGNALLLAVGDQRVAVTGPPADLIHIDAEGHRRSARRPVVDLSDGEALELGVPQSGCRTYLAVSGGFAGPAVLGSLSTDTFSGLGSRPVAAGDLLTIGNRPVPRMLESAATAGPPVSSIPDLPALDAVPGPRDDWFTEAAVESFFTQPWLVTAESNRVGLRLSGDPLERARPGELESEGMLPGAVQVPTGGQPVVFGRDHPVTGGYPVIAVLTPDAQNTAGQLPAGAHVRFRRV